MRIVVLLVPLFVACGPPPKPTRPDGTGTGGTGKVAGGGQQPTPPGAMKDIGCHVASCAYHPGTATYFTCQSGGAGTCFHFGAACTPEAACMFDAQTRTYKTCTSPVEGACTAWGAACAPASKCMFDPADHLHKQCDDIAGGACKRYGALCAP